METLNGAPHGAGVVRRFLHYVRYDTQSDPSSHHTPSTEKQKFLSRLLAEELRELGVEDAYMDEFGYVCGTVPSNLPVEIADQTPVLALIAHVDTSPDESGKDVVPRIHPNYQGEAIRLGEDGRLVLDPERDPALLAHLGHDIITSDGTTLLGSDDKAGVAIIMQLVEDVLSGEQFPRPPIRICFTVDEEIGRGVDKLDLIKLGADVAYTLDGSGTDTISVETFNAAEAVVRVGGVMVHPGYARGIMVNALRIVSDLIASIPSDQVPETTGEREGYFHAHQLSGGSPQEVELRILLRDFDQAGLAARKRWLEDRVAALRMAYPGSSIDLKISDTYKNMRTYIEERDLRVIEFAFEAARLEGIELEQEPIRGGTDGARLSEMGLPTPNLFTGGHQFHSRLEWNTVQNLERALGFVKALVRYWGENGANTNPR